jgi:hypothetical protein
MSFGRTQAAFGSGTGPVWTVGIASALRSRDAVTSTTERREK